VSLTQRCRQGAIALTAVLGVACVADAGGDAKPAFTSGEVSGGDDATTEDVGNVPIDSGEMPDNGSICPSTTPTRCSGTCVDTSSNVDNCGDCGSACTAGATCSEGHCTSMDAGANATVEAGMDSGVDGQALADAGADARADSSIESGVDAQAVPDSSVVDAAAPADAHAEASDAQPCPACTGCCDTGGNCSKGTSATACGVEGVYCVDCTASSLTCHTGGICR
jgi:hypothetical protein